MVETGNQTLSISRPSGLDNGPVLKLCKKLLNIFIVITLSSGFYQESKQECAQIIICKIVLGKICLNASFID